MRTIRRRLIVSLLAGAGLLVLAVGWGASTLIARRLRHEFDESLHAKARALVTLTKQHRGHVEIDFADEFMPEFEAESQPEYFELWLADGTVLERSRSLGGRDLPRFPVLSNAAVYRDLRLPDSRPGRLVEIAFVPQIEDDDAWPERALDPNAPPASLHSAVLAVAKSRQPLDELIRSLHAATVGTATLLLGGLAVLVHVAVGSGLAPLEEIGHQVQALDAERLDGRVAVEPPVRELAPVVEQLNALLARLEAAFDRERRFASDVAHELRTPVAELRNLSEVGSRWPEDREAVRGFFEDTRSIALQMERTVGTLLALARCEGGLEETELGRFVLSDLLAEAWSACAAEAAARGLRLALVAPAVALVSDAGKLRLILGNLFSNAVAYSPSGSLVSCAAQAREGALEITVANPAPHLTEADLSHLFERFWRKDAARTNGRHSGLGLALARSLATLLRFELTAHLDADGRLAVRLRGPAGPGP